MLFVCSSFFLHYSAYPPPRLLIRVLAAGLFTFVVCETLTECCTLKLSLLPFDLSYTARELFFNNLFYLPQGNIVH